MTVEESWIESLPHTGDWDDRCPRCGAERMQREVRDLRDLVEKLGGQSSDRDRTANLFQWAAIRDSIRSMTDAAKATLKGGS